MKEMKGVIESLLAHIRKYLGLWGEKNSNKTANVLLVELNTRIGHIHLKKEENLVPNPP